MTAAFVVFSALTFVVACVALGVACAGYLMLSRIWTDYLQMHGDMKTVLSTTFDLLSKTSEVYQVSCETKSQLKLGLDKAASLAVPSKQEDLRQEFEKRVADLPKEFQDRYMKDDMAYEKLMGHRRLISREMIDEVNTVSRLNQGT
jgi:hypothetical protein